MISREGRIFVVECLFCICKVLGSIPSIYLLLKGSQLARMGEA